MEGTYIYKARSIKDAISIQNLRMKKYEQVYKEKKNEIWLSPMTKTRIPTKIQQPIDIAHALILVRSVTPLSQQKM